MLQRLQIYVLACHSCRFGLRVLGAEHAQCAKNSPRRPRRDRSGHLVVLLFGLALLGVRIRRSSAYGGGRGGRVHIPVHCGCYASRARRACCAPLACSTLHARCAPHALKTGDAAPPQAPATVPPRCFLLLLCDAALADRKRSQSSKSQSKGNGDHLPLRFGGDTPRKSAGRMCVRPASCRSPGLDDLGPTNDPDLGLVAAWPAPAAPFASLPAVDARLPADISAVSATVGARQTVQREAPAVLAPEVWLAFGLGLGLGPPCCKRRVYTGRPLSALSDTSWSCVPLGRTYLLSSPTCAPCACPTPAGTPCAPLFPRTPRSNTFPPPCAPCPPFSPCPSCPPLFLSWAPAPLCPLFPLDPPMTPQIDRFPSPELDLRNGNRLTARSISTLSTYSASSSEEPAQSLKSYGGRGKALAQITQ